VHHTVPSIPAACVAAGVLALFGAVPSAAAPSAPTAGPACRGEATGSFKPGMSVKANRGTVFARDGKVECAGAKVLGRSVTGPGTYDAAARYGANDDVSCVSGGTGWMVQTITFPTADGPLVVQSAATYSFGALSEDGLLTGRYRGDFVDGTFSMVPTKGDCVTSPVTAGRIIFTADFHPYRPPA
jgi:hypothetical protein